MEKLEYSIYYTNVNKRMSSQQYHKVVIYFLILTELMIFSGSFVL